MTVSLMFVAALSIVAASTAAVPIREALVDILEQHTYVAFHTAHQIGLGLDSSDLVACIYACHNHEFCRTAVFDPALHTCILFEECSNMGRVLPESQKTLVSFQVCPDGPEYINLNAPAPRSIPMDTVLSNLAWIKELTPASDSWIPFFVNDEIYVPRQNTINVYETENYRLARTILIPVTSMINYLRGDSQGVFIYNQVNDTNIYIYSLKENLLTVVPSSLMNTPLCYSASFIVITSRALNVVDVYRRSVGNNSAAFMYRANSWLNLAHCVILNDQQLIVGTVAGGLQTMSLSTTGNSSSFATIPMATSYLPTSAMINIDAAGRLYTSPIWSAFNSTVFLPDGRLIGTHSNTHDCAGKASKYKFIFIASVGSRVYAFEYQP